MSVNHPSAPRQLTRAKEAETVQPPMTLGFRAQQTVWLVLALVAVIELLFAAWLVARMAHGVS